MTELVLEAPNAKQREAMLAKQRYVAFGGARGGGKSWMVRTKSILLAMKHPGIRITIFRRTYPELQQNHINIMRPQLMSVAKYNASEKCFRFNNGSYLKFNYCENDRDVDRYQGQEYDVIFFDEATQFSEDQMKRIVASCRGVNNFPKRVYFTCNPGGQGHEYIKRLFIDREYEGKERPEDYYFVQSLVWDNKALLEADEEYVQNLEVLPEKLKKAWLYGEWDIFEGMFFEEFRKTPDAKLCEAAGITPAQAAAQHRYTHVIEPFEIPNSWTICRSFDFGYSRPFSCDWWAVDFDGRAYLIAQYYGCTGEPNEGLKMHPDAVFTEIARIEREHRWLKGKRIRGVADPAIWDASTGVSVAEIGERHGIYFDPADHARLPGWMQCHYRMAFDEEGRPMVYFFSTCKDAIRTIPLMMYSETQPEDLDTTGEDHFADSMRYFFMSRPIKPRAVQVRRMTRIGPLDLEF